ncbi:hypothetical protein L3X07_11310 [Levilactobacillus brevis]|nr:hypothetical protein [Levilactobacillus brevis]
MEKQIAIIGGGIIGATALIMLSTLPGGQQVKVTLFDDGLGQATTARPVLFHLGYPNGVINSGIS